METTQIISLIYDFYKQNIENILSLRLISDCQFVSTVKMIRFMAFIFVMFMVVPFLIQMRSETPSTVIVCLTLMMAVQLFLFAVEMLQLRNLTFKVYSADKWNLVELLMTLVSIVYVIVRATQVNKSVIP